LKLYEEKIKRLFLIESLSIPEIQKATGIPLKEIEKTLKSFPKKKISNIEKASGIILRRIYPNHKIIPQYPIGGFYIDYYIDELRLAWEIDGIQHFEPNNFFHGSSTYERMNNYHHQINNDEDKSNLAKKAYITFIRIKYNDPITIEFFRSKINEYSDRIISNLRQYAKASMSQNSGDDPKTWTF